MNAVTSLEEFKLMVKEFWAGTEEIFLSTSSLFRFSKKLKSLKPLIRNLAKDKMGNLVKKAKEAHEKLCKALEVNLCSPSIQNQQLESEAYSKWEFVAGLEEDFLKQRSKLHWLSVGDQNNKTYHRAIITREAINGIREVRCRDGTLVTEESEIKAEAEGFFQEFLQPDDFTGMTVENLQDLLPFRCVEQDQHVLVRPVTPEEVRQVLFSMPSNKSPGPDG